MTRSNFHPNWLLAAFMAMATLAGCAAPQPVPEAATARDLLPAEVENRAETVARDPLAYLEEVAGRCRQLEQYTLVFTRTERRGLFGMLHGPEHIRCWFRQTPFSVRMKWIDEDIKYNESVYVAGQHDDKVRFVTRWWSPPLLPPPNINRVSLQTPVIWGESKRPLTHFGLQRLMDRILAALESAGQDVIVTYEGVRVLEQSERTVHHIHLEYPADRYDAPVQELYIDVATDLPAGIVMKQPSGKLDAAYFYENVDADVCLTDNDFLLTVERDTTTDAPETQTK